MPNLTLAESKFKNYQLGKYGRRRLNYLENHVKAEYIILFIDNRRYEHLYDIDMECQKQFEYLMKPFAEKENITKELKVTNQMEWVQRMDNIKNSVEEIIFYRTLFLNGYIRKQQGNLFPAVFWFVRDEHINFLKNEINQM